MDSAEFTHLRMPPKEPTECENCGRIARRKMWFSSVPSRCMAVIEWCDACQWARTTHETYPPKDTIEGSNDCGGTGETGDDKAGEASCVKNTLKAGDLVEDNAGHRGFVWHDRCDSVLRIQWADGVRNRVDELHPTMGVHVVGRE